jgi:hypothetical protein
MTATGATGKPMSYLVPELLIHKFQREQEAERRRGQADPASCPHSTKTFKAGAWSCRRCGVAL